MVVFILLLLAGIWHLYNFATLFYNLPYLDLCKSGNFLLESFHMISMKWCLPFGVIFTLVGVLGLIFMKRDTNNFERIKWGLLVLAVILSAFLCL
jgi:hypothetical protein